MYKLTLNGDEFTIPKENIVFLALHQALQRGVKQGNIHDEKTAIEYLKSIGVEIEILDNNTKV